MTCGHGAPQPEKTHNRMGIIHTVVKGIEHEKKLETPRQHLLNKQYKLHIQADRQAMILQSWVLLFE